MPEVCTASHVGTALVGGSDSRACKLCEKSCCRVSSLTEAALPDTKVHEANMGPIWVLSAPGGPHVGPTNLAISPCFKAMHGNARPAACHLSPWLTIRGFLWCWTWPLPCGPNRWVFFGNQAAGISCHSHFTRGKEEVQVTLRSQVPPSLGYPGRSCQYQNRSRSWRGAAGQRKQWQERPVTIYCVDMGFIISLRPSDAYMRQ